MVISGWASSVMREKSPSRAEAVSLFLLALSDSPFADWDDRPVLIITSVVVR